MEPESPPILQTYTLGRLEERFVYQTDKQSGQTIS